MGGVGGGGDVDAAEAGREPVEFSWGRVVVDLSAGIGAVLHGVGGDGNRVGVCRGVEAGWLDTMLTPWKYNLGKVLVMRDAENAVRYLDTGNMPLPKEVKEYHREKILEREKKEGRKAGLDMVVEDIQFASVMAARKK